MNKRSSLILGLATVAWATLGNPARGAEEHNPRTDAERVKASAQAPDTGEDTSAAVTIGANRVGGHPRTAGYWKRWNSCTGGSRHLTAANNGGPEAGWFILDDILNDPGISWDDSLEDDTRFHIRRCEAGVSLLDQRDTESGEQQADDAAYRLAMHLLAAQLNFATGAATCQEAQDAALAAELLLDEIDFIGTGAYLGPEDAAYQTALELAATLDQYNRGLLRQSTEAEKE